MIGAFEDGSVGLVAPGFGFDNPILSCLDLRAAAAASLAEPSWVLELAELGGRFTFAVNIGFVEPLPADVWDVNLGTEEVLIVMAFCRSPVGDCGFVSISSASSLVRLSAGVVSFSIGAGCLG